MVYGGVSGATGNDNTGHIGPDGSPVSPTVTDRQVVRRRTGSVQGKL